jgi:protein-S-isoprenylcysteine O-methyltransferase Ste14
MGTPDEAHAPWWRGAKGEWYVVAQGLLFVLIAVGPRSWPGAPEWGGSASAVTFWAGIALMLSGALLAVAGLLALGPSLSALPYPTDDAHLVETGPYAIVRHPIYSGLVLGALGWGLFLHAWLTMIFAVALFVLFDAKSRREEKWLCERFPDYAEYKTRVKKLVPWVY